jgi:hypothetical protein
MQNENYRLIVGETGNELGHIHECGAKSLDGARRALRRLMRPYGGDGWGVICDVIGNFGNRQYPRIERHGRA